MELRQRCSEVIASALMKLGPKPEHAKQKGRRQMMLASTGEGYDDDSYFGQEADEQKENDYDYDECEFFDEVAAENTQRHGDKRKTRKKSKRLHRNQQVNHILREIASG